MKKLLWLVLALLLLITLFVAAGPFLTLYSLKHAADENRLVPVVWLVDFPAVRTSLKAQLNDQVVRSAGSGVQSSVIGQLGLRASRIAVEGAVEATVNPAGIAGLMQGRKAVAAWSASGSGHTASSTGDTPKPLDKQLRYESASRFTATLMHDDGTRTVFVLTRSGLLWKLSDIRLPLRATAQRSAVEIG